MHKTNKISLILLFLCLLSPFVSAVAQEQDPIKSEQEQKTEFQELEKRTHNLATILSTIQRFETERSTIQASLASANAKGRESELLLKIEDLSQQISILENDFVEIATGVKLSDKENSDLGAQRELTTELYILLRPIIKELQDLTSRPREIDQLKSRLAVAERDLKTLEAGLSQINKLLTNDQSSQVQDRIKLLQKRWLADYKIQKTQRDVLDDKLKKILASQKTFVETFSELSSIFFKSRGRNLIFAFLTSLIFCLSLRRLRMILEKRWSNARYSLKKRMIFVGIWTASIVGSVLLFILVLFFLGDWVLVVISFSILFGLLWGIKQFIPIFWAQIILLLNMGAVREGERIKYRGVVWQVKRLHVQVLLENPVLAGRTLRIPLKDLVDLRSWNAADSEPWFPSKKGDWVILADGTFGQVQIQSVETVVIEQKGETPKHYLMADYLSLQPQVLSSGFRISSIVGLDYSLISNAAEEIPSKLQTSVKIKMESLGYDSNSLYLSVEFNKLADSSLEFALIADFNGRHATDYQKLTRLIQRLALEVSIENNWTIPFPQMSIHLNKTQN